MVAPQQEEVIEVEIGVKSNESTLSGIKPYLSDKIKQYF
jgi:hypothetical protein